MELRWIGFVGWLHTRKMNIFGTIYQESLHEAFADIILYNNPNNYPPIMNPVFQMRNPSPKEEQ